MKLTALALFMAASFMNRQQNKMSRQIYREKHNGNVQK
jgi:hypothetical protein